MDPRIDDRGACNRERAGYLAEQPGIIRAVDRHLGDRPRRQRLRIDRQRGFSMLRVPNQPRVTSMGFRIERQPISGIAEFGEMLDLLRGPIGQQRSDSLLRSRDTHISFGGGQASRQHLRDAGIKLPQQRRLPAVPDLARNRAHVGDGQNQQQPQALG